MPKRALDHERQGVQVVNAVVVAAVEPLYGRLKGLYAEEAARRVA